MLDGPWRAALLHHGFLIIRMARIFAQASDWYHYVLSGTGFIQCLTAMKSAHLHTRLPDSRDCLHAFHPSDVVRHLLASKFAIDVLQTSFPSLELLGSLTANCPVPGCLLVSILPASGIK